MPREIAELAQNQLRAWEYLASTWPVKHEVKEDGQTYAVCLECHDSIWGVTDRWLKPFRYNEGETQALMVAHLRRKHADWEALVYRVWESKHGRTIT